MDLINCSKCGRVFAFTGSQVCSRCSSSDEDDFKKVKEYLYDNPGASVFEVSQETGVAEKQILRFLRESRIEVRESSNYILDCERCGTSIRSGRFCDKCVAAMQKEFSSVLGKKPEEKPITTTRTGNRMHVADMRKKR